MFMHRKSLSKSKLLSLRQCPLRLWNEVYHRELAAETDVATQARFDNGTRIGELARDRWSGGVLVDTEYWDVEGALGQTRALLEDPKCKAIYEAAFIVQRTFIRADIMVRLHGQQWELWEVKSVGSAKDIHEIDVAIQRKIIEFWAKQNEFQLEIVRAGVLHLNKEYVYPGGEYDLQQLYSEHDLTTQTDQYLGEVNQLLELGTQVIDSSSAPVVYPGSQCSDPYACPFLGTACEIPPRDELTLLPGAGPARADKWHDEGIDELDQLDASTLNATQARALRAHQTGKLQIERGLKEQIDAIGYPRYHLDFESTGSLTSLPRWAGTRPFQAIPFQFSLHLERGPGQTVLHDGYLHSDSSDPRRPLSEALIQQASIVSGKILTYSGYEHRMLGELIQACPDLESDLSAIQDRLMDLLPIIREHVYHPKFEGSFSIKSVLPALCDDLSYDGLAIADGDTAALRFLEMIDRMEARKVSGDEDPEIENIRNDLWIYCRRDTEAMVALINRVYGLAETPTN